jgi:hypothetical protein
MPNTGERRGDHCTRKCEGSGNRSGVSEAGVENKAALRKQGRKEHGAKRQGTEGSISRTYRVIPGFVCDGEGPRET